MLFKYASNLLQNISNECKLKSFACKDDEVSVLYQNIASRIDGLICRLGVEEVGGNVISDND
jgi:hypothetical protein